MQKKDFKKQKSQLSSIQPEDSEQGCKQNGITPNRNSFYNWQNALLQESRNMHFFKVQSMQSIRATQQEYQKSEDSNSPHSRTDDDASPISIDSVEICMEDLLAEEEVDSAASNQEESTAGHREDLEK